MNAVAERHSGGDRFVGQVLMRSSPVLTWRPALAAKLREEELDANAKTIRLPQESAVRLSLSRISKLTTRRMEALPVVRKVARGTSSRSGGWSMVVRVALGFLVGSLFIVLGLVTTSMRGASSNAPLTAKSIAVRVVDAPIDTLTTSTSPASPELAPAAKTDTKAPVAAAHKPAAKVATAAKPHATTHPAAHKAQAKRTASKHH